MCIGITDLPSELLYATFDFLDLIDSTCFGLTNKHFYAIHRHLHGFVSLSSRRDGPNDLEWAWRLAGLPIYHPNHPRSADNVVTTTTSGTPNHQCGKDFFVEKGLSALSKRPNPMIRLLRPESCSTTIRTLQLLMDGDFDMVDALTRQRFSQATQMK